MDSQRAIQGLSGNIPINVAQRQPYRTNNYTGTLIVKNSVITSQFHHNGNIIEHTINWFYRCLMVSSQVCRNTISAARLASVSSENANN